MDKPAFLLFSWTLVFKCVLQSQGDISIVGRMSEGSAAGGTPTYIIAAVSVWNLSAS